MVARVSIRDERSRADRQGHEEEVKNAGRRELETRKTDYQIRRDRPSAEISVDNTHTRASSFQRGRSFSSQSTPLLPISAHREPGKAPSANPDAPPSGC